VRDSTVGDNIPGIAWKLLWLLGAVIAIVSIAADALLPASNHVIGRDFTNLWLAGKLASAGDAQCVFDAQCFRDAMHQTLGLITSQNYSYPPPALFLAVPFGIAPYYVALATWTVAGTLFFVWCARPTLPSGFSPFLAALTPAATINIWAGHYGFLLGGLWLLCFRFLDERPKLSGIFAGLQTFKPHLGLMIALTMLRDRRAFTTAVLTTIALVVLSVAVFGPAPWREFFMGTRSQQQIILTSANDTLYFKMMPSAYVAYGKGGLGIAAQAVFAVTALALLGWKRRWDAFSAATATFVLIPYVFNYDMTVACLGFAIAVYRRWNSMRWLERSVFLLAFVSPELTYFVPYLVPPVLLAALCFQLREAEAHVPQRSATTDEQRTSFGARDGSAIV
jgi:alpha-1,2-mannosyltransferase